MRACVFLRQSGDGLFDHAYLVDFFDDLGFVEFREFGPVPRGAISRVRF